MQIGGNMKKLSTLEMKNISGGGTISGSLFSALAKGFNVFVDMGRALGSSIRRLVNNNMCDF
jgi:bacteriocin-like protein